MNKAPRDRKWTCPENENISLIFTCPVSTHWCHHPLLPHPLSNPFSCLAQPFQRCGFWWLISFVPFSSAFWAPESADSPLHGNSWSVVTSHSQFWTGQIHSDDGRYLMLSQEIQIRGTMQTRDHQPDFHNFTIWPRLSACFDAEISIYFALTSTLRRLLRKKQSDL